MKKFLLSLATVMLASMSMTATTGDGSKENPYTIADLAELNNPGTEAWVTGTIVGCFNWDDNNSVNVFSATELTTASNIALASSATATDYIAVQLVAGTTTRTALNLVDNSGNLGKTVSVYGALSYYIVSYGVKSTSDYILDGVQGSAGSDDTEVDPSDLTGDGTEDNPYTVADVKALNIMTKDSGTPAWITGYVVGSFNGYSLSTFTTATGSDASGTNIAIAATADETNYSNTIPVALPSGTIRSALNLKDVPGMLGKEVKLYGDLMAYFGTAGLKNTSAYDVEGGTPEVEVKEVATLTEFIEEQDEDNYYKITGTVTVTHHSGNYLFITDGTSNLEVYGSLTNTYKNGDQLTGIIGKFGYYSNMPQMSPLASSFGEAIEGSPVEPNEVSLDKVTLAEYVVVKGVDIVANGSLWNVTDGNSTRQLYNRFSIDGVQALEGTTITGIGAIYGETLQLFPITIEGGTEGDGDGDDDDPVDPTPGNDGGVTIEAAAFNGGDDTASNSDIQGTQTISGYTFDFQKTDNGTNAPAYYYSPSAVRLYADNELTISGGDLTKIVFTLATSGTKRYTYLTPSTGAMTPEQTADDTEAVWEGNATSVTFTVGHDAELGTDGAEKRGQFHFSAITIYGEEGAIEEIRFNNDGTAVIYNLRGQRLSAPEKGLNIINGQKVLVK